MVEPAGVEHAPIVDRIVFVAACGLLKIPRGPCPATGSRDNVLKDLVAHSHSHPQGLTVRQRQNKLLAKSQPLREH